MKTDANRSSQADDYRRDSYSSGSRGRHKRASSSDRQGSAGSVQRDSYGYRGQQGSRGYQYQQGYQANRTYQDPFDEDASYASTSYVNTGANVSAGDLSYGYQPSGYSAAPKKKRGKRIAIGIVVALLVIAIGIGGAIAWYVNGVNNSLNSELSKNKEAMSLLSNELNEPFYVLLVGTDSRDPNQTSVPSEEVHGDSSDVIMLVRVDKAKKTVHLLSIPRDTPWVDDNGNYDKINASYAQKGAAGIIAAVEQVSGVDIDHFAHVNFLDFEKMVDAVGGITVDVPITVGYEDAFTDEYIEVQAGEQNLNGQQALILARARHEYGDNQEAMRQSMVRTIMVSIFSKLKDLPVTEMPGALAEVAKCVSTDFKVGDIVDLGLALRDDTTVYSATAPYEGDYIEELDGIWLCYIDTEGWKKIIAAIDSGSDPASISYVGDTATIAGTDKTVVIQEG